MEEGRGWAEARADNARDGAAESARARERARDAVHEWPTSDEGEEIEGDGRRQNTTGRRSVEEAAAGGQEAEAWPRSR